METLIVRFGLGSKASVIRRSLRRYRRITDGGEPVALPEDCETATAESSPIEIRVDDYLIERDGEAIEHSEIRRAVAWNVARCLAMEYEAPRPTPEQFEAIQQKHGR
jgi:hypothetical protein